MYNISIQKNKISQTGNWTPVSRVTGGDTHHYTIWDLIETVKIKIYKACQNQLQEKNNKNVTDRISRYHQKVSICLVQKFNWYIKIPDSIVVSIPACHAGDRGSIPRLGDFIFFKLGLYWHYKVRFWYNFQCNLFVTAIWSIYWIDNSLFKLIKEHMLLIYNIKTI